MSKRKAVIVAIVAIVALAAVPLVYAQNARHHRGGMMMFGNFEKIKTALGLTDDQVAQLKTIRENLKAQNAPYREQMRGGFAAVAQTLLKNPNDVAAAQAVIDQQAAARKAMQTNVLQAASKALNVLTPDQRVKVSQFLQERNAMREQHMRMHE